MQYSINVTADAVYDINLRVAANGFDSKVKFASGTADISEVESIPSSGGWENWQTVTISDVVLTSADTKLRFIVEKDGFNLSSFEFVQKGALSTLPTEFVSAVTIDQQSVQLNINKPLNGPLPASPSDFQIFVNGNTIPITNTTLDANTRMIRFDVNHNFKSSETITISYNGNQIMATDGTILAQFTQEVVQNTVAIVHTIPGRVEAEDYFFQLGVQLEATTDAGGGFNIGFLDAGDYLDYYIDVDKNGIYNVEYRTAAESEMGAVRMELIDENGNATTLHDVSFPSTGGWQTWTNTSKTLVLDKGRHHLRMAITQPLFNMNWFEFTFLTSNDDINQIPDLNLYPNPGNGLFSLQGTFEDRQDVEITVTNIMGQVLLRQQKNHAIDLNETIDLKAYPNGNYFVSIRMENGAIYTKKLVKI